MQNSFKNKLYDLRIKNNITQDELAKRIGVSRQAISKWERGEGLPDLYNSTLLAKALGVTVDELVNKEIEYNNSSYNHNASSYNNKSTKNYLKKLLYKAKHTTNSQEAKKIRRILLIVGGIGALTGIIMVITGFLGFINGAMGQTFRFDPSDIPTEPIEIKPFNPISHMFMFLGGGIVFGISMYVLFAGLSIVVAEVTTKYLDDREKCPNCGDEIDADEKICSSCGYDLTNNPNYRCECGKINQKKDKFCRECGKELNF